jgi:tetratricopeptide (TPR) repeat protein
MSTYQGNPSLPQAVKDRVTSTFQQALTLFQQGRTDDVVSGCQLILQMDPSFDPARKLLEQTRMPAAGLGVDELNPSGNTDEVMRQARAAMVARDYQRVIQLTTEVLTNDLMNDDARVLSDQAREKMEAGTFIDLFFRKFDEHISAGNMTAARADLDKARALDGEHPAILRMERMLAVQQPPSPAPSGGFDGGTSFVIDTPASPRGTAQASDFGFTFEEEKTPAPAAGAGGFSFDASPAAPAESGGFNNFSFGAPAAPAAPAASDAPFAGGFSFDAPAPAAGGFSFDSGAPAAAKTPAGEFDFSTASIDATPADQQKIDQYLADGDRAFDSGDYQQAIDHWSRIFLIDVTNEAASDRIEKAKVKRREVEQRIEPLLNAGAGAFERGDRDAAKLKFNEALRLDPGNASARDYLDRLSVLSAPAPSVREDYMPAAETSLNDDFFDDAPMGAEDVLVPPDIPPPSATAGKPSKKTAAPAPTTSKPSKSLPLGLIGTVVAVVALLAGGWFAWQKFTKPASDPGATQATFSQAQSLAQKGKYDQAILLLQDVKPDDPQHDKALNLIADLQHKKTQAAEMVNGRPAAVVFQESLANGKTLFDAHDYDGAKKEFEQAMRVRPLPPDMKAAYETAAQQVSKLDAAKTLLKERHYQDAITNLQALAQDDPQNKNIARLLLDAHFNMGATALQEEKLPEAISEFDEVLKAEPGDELAKRSRELAVRYKGQAPDLLYKIYVKYLPLREVS